MFQRWILIALMAIVMVTHAQDTPPDLPQAVFTQDNTMLVNYPDGWTAEPFLNTGISLTNSADILEADGPVIPTDGQLYVQVTYNPRGPYLTTDDTIVLEDLLALVFAEFDGLDVLFTEPETDTLDDAPLLSTSATLDLNGTPATAAILVIDRPDAASWVLMTALMPEGALEANLPTLRAILSAVEIDGTRIPRISRAESIVSENGELTIANAEHYFTQLEANTNIAVGTRFGLLGDQTFSSIQPGDLIYRINLQPRIFLFSDETQTISDLINVAMEGYRSADIPLEVIEFDVDGHPAARASFTANPGDLGEVDLFYLFIDYAPIDRVLVLIAVSSSGQMSAFENYLLNVPAGILFNGEAIAPREDGE